MDVNLDLQTALIHGTAGDVRHVLQIGADPNHRFYGVNTVFYVVRAIPLEDRESKLRALLDAGAHVAVREDGPENRTPFQYACALRNLPTARILLEYGALIDARRHESGWTALHAAAMAGYDDVCLFLLQNGAEIDLKTTIGQYTALHYAAFQGHVDFARVLLENGASANVTTSEEYGSTPLHLLSSDYEGMARLLLEYGADLNFKDEGGSTPLDVSIFRGHHAVTAVFLEFRSQQLLAHDNMHPTLWAHVLANVNRNTGSSRADLFYSILREKPDLFNFNAAADKKKSAVAADKKKRKKRLIDFLRALKIKRWPIPLIGSRIARRRQCKLF